MKKKAQKGGALATLSKPAAKVRDYDAHVLVCKGGDGFGKEDLTVARAGVREGREI